MTGADNLTLHVRLSTENRFTIPAATSSKVITKGSTVQFVKECIEEHEQSDHCAVARQRLIFRGRILSDNTKTLEEYGVVENNAVLHLVKGSAPAAAPRSVAAPTSTSTAIPSTRSTGTSTPPTTGAGDPFDFSSMMAGANMNPMQNPMMQQMMSNPEFMSSMLNSPIFQNPDLLMNMMNANPQMRELMDANPQLRHVLQDPQILQQTMQAMRDPSHMANMMRNQDLAMSQIENYPGGFNALRRMYEEVQEPMMDAMSGSAGSGTSSSGTPSTTTGTGSEGGAMPNPWGGGSSRPANRSAPMANPWATPSSTGGAAPAGMPDMSALMSGAGGAPGMEATLQMLENPMISQMMNQMMSNPQMMEQMMTMNPQLRQMRETNPQMAAMFSNPEMMRTMMNPEVLRSIMTLQRAFEGVGIPGAGANTGPASIPGAGGLDFASLLTQMQNTGLGGGAPAANPARMDALVQQLVDMGFDDRHANRQALQASHMNINRAVDWLLEQPASYPPASNNDTSNNNNTEGGSGQQ